MKLTPTPQPTFSGLIISKSRSAINRRSEAGQIPVNPGHAPIEIKLVSVTHPHLNRDEVLISDPSSTMLFQSDLVGQLTDRFDLALISPDVEDPPLSKPSAATEFGKFRQELPQELLKICAASYAQPHPELHYIRGRSTAHGGSLSGANYSTTDDLTSPEASEKLASFLPGVQRILESFNEEPDTFWPTQEMTHVEYHPQKRCARPQQINVPTLKMVGADYLA